MERKIRRITNAKRSLRSVFGFLGEVGIICSPGKVSHRRERAESGNHGPARKRRVQHRDHRAATECTEKPEIRRGGGLARGVRR
jgi:hypothetical protein